MTSDDVHPGSRIVCHNRSCNRDEGFAQALQTALMAEGWSRRLSTMKGNAMFLQSSLRPCAPALLALALAGAWAPPASAMRIRTAAAGPEGHTAHTAVARRGPYGGGVVRGRTVSTDGHGNANIDTRAAARGPEGGRGTRSANTTLAADGSATHHGEISAANARGTFDSTSAASRDAAGNVSASRDSTLTSKATGNSAHASTSYTRTDEGIDVQRSVTCRDAGGNTIPCR